MDCDWPGWIMFSAAMVSSYFQEMRLRKERNDPRYSEACVCVCVCACVRERER